VAAFFFIGGLWGRLVPLAGSVFPYSFASLGSRVLPWVVVIRSPWFLCDPVRAQVMGSSRGIAWFHEECCVRLAVSGPWGCRALGSSSLGRSWGGLWAWSRCGLQHSC
jgi:hypothetical protein